VRRRDRWPLGADAAAANRSDGKPDQERPAMKKLAIVLTLIFAFSATSMLSACNTTRGAGEDLQAGGKALSNSAEKNKPY
jgi:entericidin B